MNIRVFLLTVLAGIAWAGPGRGVSAALERIVVSPDGRGFDVVVQCTALGMHAGDPLPIDPATLAPPTALVEIVAVRETELMAAAAARGCTVVGGRPMAELQIDAQLAFIGRPPPLGPG